jgi:hypothetical protein
MDYPRDFPAESRAKVEAAIIRSGRQFDSKRAKAKWRSDIETLFWTYVLTPFVVFAGESSRLGLWPADEMDRNCREFLRRLTIDAYYQKGRAAGLREMISNWNGSILWEAQQEIEKTAQWRKYENIRLKFAVKGRPTTQSTGIMRGQFSGLPSWQLTELMQRRVEASDRLRTGEKLAAQSPDPVLDAFGITDKTVASERSTVHSSGKIAQIANSKPADRRAQIDAFIFKVMEETPKKVTRKDIWLVAGYRNATEFERFQRNDVRTTQSATANFERVLRMKPENFIRSLEKKRAPQGAHSS